MKREFRSTHELELRQEPGEPVKIRGYAAVFNQLSEPIMGWFRERILPGAFTKSLGADVRALVDHDPSKIIGRTKSKTLSLREDAHGLYVEIVPSNTVAGRDVVESVKRGDLDQMSFGFRALGEEWKKENGEQIREITEAELFDVSVVAFPAYTQTEVSVRSLFPDGVPEAIESRATEETPVVVEPTKSKDSPPAAPPVLEKKEAAVELRKKKFGTRISKTFPPIEM